MKMFELFFCIATLTIGCGGTEKYDRQTKKYDGWARVKPIINEYCKPCHVNAAFVNSGDAFKSGKAGTRIQNRSMPSPGSPQADKITNEERAKLLAYIKEKEDPNNGKY